MATTKEAGAVPDFLRMDQSISSDPANAKKPGNWHGWPTKDINPVTLTDEREPRYNNMRKNFSAIVGYTVTVA